MVILLVRGNRKSLRKEKEKKRVKWKPFATNPTPRPEPITYFYFFHCNEKNTRSATVPNKWRKSRKTRPA